jgi:basic membrane protein A
MTSIHGISLVQANYAVDQTTKVAIVYSTGGLGDLSFNDAAKRGVDAAKATHGSALVVDEACESACDIDDINQALADFASSGDYELVIGIGFSAGDGVAAAAASNADQDFMIIDFVVESSPGVLVPNINNIVFKEQEGSFLAGAMAAMVTNTKTLGFLGGLDIPLINRFYAGFEHGARYMDGSITVIGDYSPDPNNPWGDLAGGAVVADTMIENGADIIFAAAGGTGIGVMNAVADANDEAGEKLYYAIGVDSDQDSISEGNVLTSMLKKVDVAVEGDIDAVMAGSWSAGVSSLGLKEGGVDISAMTYTQDIRNGEYKDDETRIEVIENLKQLIIDGDIIVAETLDDLDDIEEGAYVAQTADTIPLPFLPAIFAIVAVVAIVRRRKN